MIRVAISEDDFRVAQIHEAFLKKISGVTVVGKAVNAKETLALLETEQVDLLLLDVFMPDRLGSDLLHEIRLKHPEVDIIMISAAQEKEFIRKAMNYGVFYYLIKPVQLEQFKEVMEQYKEKRQLLDSNEEIAPDMIKELFNQPTKDSPLDDQQDLPTGINSITLRKVIELIESHQEGLTTDIVSQNLGASRTTARRYLEYLVGKGLVNAESVYGIVGRPERKYYPVKS
ncbi:response regulator [Planococcus lenghuensis]|uniref:Transcriptional regulatory protein n=1 Tax=Planococcus lenghuensis TaxID=2213202 RepID=A0A1Q2KVI9_9BACL|nr:response regulator [Planococcus lenghuensis]AQQ52211.1 DNA-binding response regulator [Planococcus lenghuensis]